MLHPDNPDIVFWGTGDFRTRTTGAGLFRSGDGEESWTLVAGSSSTGAQITGLSHSGGVPGLMHLAGSSGVLRTADAGATSPTKISGTANSLWSGPGATRLYAGMRGDGVYRSGDGGANWTKCTSARTANPTSAADRVALWTALSATNTTASATATINRFAVAEGDPNTIYTGCSGGSVWVTRDRGATWTKRSAGLPTDGVCGIAVNPHDDEEVWVAHYSTSGGRVYRSLNAGVTWTALGGGLPAGVTPRALGIHVRRPGESRRTVLVGSGAGIYHSFDLGAIWTPNDTSIPNANIGDFHINRAEGLATVATYGRGAWRAALPRNCWSDLDFDDLVGGSDIGLLLLDFGPCT